MSRRGVLTGVGLSLLLAGTASAEFAGGGATLTWNDIESLEDKVQVGPETDAAGTPLSRVVIQSFQERAAQPPAGCARPEGNNAPGQVRCVGLEKLVVNLGGSPGDVFDELIVSDFQGAASEPALDVKGGSGTDRINMAFAAVGGKADGGTGDDEVFGGDGKDVLSGGTGRDELQGGAGDDTLDGGAGNDSISAVEAGSIHRRSKGVDKVKGGGGDDRITANDGQKDTIDCGLGKHDEVTVDLGRLDTVKGCEKVRKRKKGAF
jgi:hypothetical protein